MLLTQSGGAQHFPIFGFRYFYAYIVCRRTTKFDVVTRGEGRGQPRLSAQRAKFQLSQIFGILLYLCLHPLMQNDRIWHGITYGAGRILGGQPRH